MTTPTPPQTPHQHLAAATSHAAHALRILTEDADRFAAAFEHDPLLRSLTAVAHGLLAHYHLAVGPIARVLGEAAPIVDAAAAAAQEAAGVQAQ